MEVRCSSKYAQGNLFGTLCYIRHLAMNFACTDAVLMIYTPQNKLRVIHCISPYVDYWLCSVAQTRQDIEKRFSASFRVIKNEAFPVKHLALKIFISILCKVHHFCQNFKKLCFILLIDVWPLCCQWYIVIVSFLTNLYALL